MIPVRFAGVGGGLAKRRSLWAILPVGLVLLFLLSGLGVVGGHPTAAAPASSPSILTISYAINQFGAQTIGPFSANGHDLLYLGIAQDYSGGGAPSLGGTGLTWTLRTFGASSGEAAVWVYTATVPKAGLSGYSFTATPNDDGGTGYLLVDLRGYAGFDPTASNPTTSFYSSTAPSAHVATHSRAVDLAFISTTAATGSVTLTPNSGQKVINGAPSPSYAVSLVYGTYSAGSHAVGGTLSSSESGWIATDALDTSTSAKGTSLLTIAYAIDQFGGQTIGPFNANGHDLLYLGIAEDYSGGGAPSLSSPGLTWTLRSFGAAPGDAAMWVYTATVPKAGLSGYSFTATPNDDGGIGYLLVDLRGYAGFDPSASDPTTSFYASATPSAHVATSARALDLAFISTDSATGSVTLTANSGQTVIDGAPSPSYAVSLVYGSYSAGSHKVGGTLSSSESGWTTGDAVDG